MRIRTLPLLALSLFGAACTRVPKTGDPLMDLVARKEVLWSPCIATGERTQLFHEDSNGPPGMLSPNRIQDLAAREAAAAIAKDWEQHTPIKTPVVLGQSTSDHCPLFVTRPAFARCYAFIEYSEPGGKIGAYILHKRNNRWEMLEKIQLVFW